MSSGSHKINLFHPNLSMEKTLKVKKRPLKTKDDRGAQSILSDSFEVTLLLPFCYSNIFAYGEQNYNLYYILLAVMTI